MREVCLAISQTSNIVDPEFTTKGSHENSDYLRKLIQGKVSETKETEGYDAILLGYGLCGNGVAGITAASIPIVIPRAHDCCTIFLGSKEKFYENFKGNLSAQWSSAGFMERGDEYLRDTDTGKFLGLDQSYNDLVEKYGEENAKYVWDTLHPESEAEEMIFIDIPQFSKLGHKEEIKAVADEKGKDMKVIQGDMRLIENLINGEWNEDEFLIVPPGKKIIPCYDFDTIFTV